MVALSDQSAPTPTAISATPVVSDRWVKASWEEFVQITSAPGFEKAKAYFFTDQMRIELMGVGANHGWDNSVLLFAITLFCTLAGIPIGVLTNTSYSSVRYKEAQPDISYYIGDRAALTPRTSSIVDLDQYPLPDLAIEIADSSLSDDLGKKRLLYEAIGIREYWVIDVEECQVIAFGIDAPASQRIAVSRVLPGLSFEVLEEALRLGRSQDQSQVGAWLMAQFREG